MVRDVFHAALERPEGERPAFLASACRDDADLQVEVQSLLASHVQAEGFLSEPAALPDTGPATEAEAGAAAPSEARDEVPPLRIGAYQAPEEGSFCGPDVPQTAAYTWRRSGGVLTLKAVRDECADRDSILSGRWQPH